MRPDSDPLSYARLFSGSLAVYLGNRRVGTIIHEGAFFAYVPVGLTQHTGRKFGTEDEVKQSILEGDPEDGA